MQKDFFFLLHLVDIISRSFLHSLFFFLYAFIHKLSDIFLLYLPFSSFSGDGEMLEALLSHPACDVDAVDGTGRTLLHWAAAAGQGAMVEALTGEGKIELERT